MILEKIKMLKDTNRTVDMKRVPVKSRTDGDG